MLIGGKVKINIGQKVKTKKIAKKLFNKDFSGEIVKDIDDNRVLVLKKCGCVEDIAIENIKLDSSKCSC
jgi:hypothetical protein